jgi:hypothetical protein
MAVLLSFVNDRRDSSCRSSVSKLLLALLHEVHQLTARSKAFRRCTMLPVTVRMLNIASSFYRAHLATSCYVVGMQGLVSG